jgi:hypothetical protein
MDRTNNEDQNFQRLYSYSSENNSKVKVDLLEESHYAPQYDLESAITEMGGFGRFQKLATVAMCLMRTGGLYLYYAFAYLTLE